MVCQGNQAPAVEKWIRRQELAFTVWQDRVAKPAPFPVNPVEFMASMGSMELQQLPVWEDPVRDLQVLQALLPRIDRARGASMAQDRSLPLLCIAADRSKLLLLLLCMEQDPSLILMQCTALGA